jgi:hypothetical protein
VAELEVKMAAVVVEATAAAVGVAAVVAAAADAVYWRGSVRRVAL